MQTTRRWVMGAAAIALALPAMAAGTHLSAQLQHWTAQAGSPANPAQGEVFFKSKHGGEWSCSSCHGAPPTRTGKHASTGKAIEPLAPAFNPEAFTDEAKTNKWFRRNCKDVLSRECTAQEKANVLAYINTLQR